MKRVFVVANTKGGVGKTTIASHILPEIFPGCEILEIDDNNQSNIFKESSFIKRFESIKVKECESKLEEITFKLLDETEEVLVIDCGGGNDTKDVLKSINELDLESLSQVTYIIPIMNSLIQAKNAEFMAHILKDKNLIFALNGVNSLSNLQKDWLFWFGSEAMGLESYFKKLNEPRTIIIPYSPLFELAALSRMSISDYSQMARKTDMATFQKKLFQKYKDDKEMYLSKLREYRRSKNAKDFLDSFIEDIKYEIVGEN